MAKFSPNVEDLKNLQKRQNEIFKRVGNGTLDPRGVYEALQPIVEGKFPVLFDPFGNYSGLLLPLDKQLELLREYNEKYWGGVITEEMFAVVDTESDHVQRVEDLEILFVQFGSDMETFENWVAVYRGEQENSWRGGSLNKGYDICQLSANTRHYSVGIHCIHINLAAHWDPKNGRSVDDVRARAKDSVVNLAHGEVFATYALHTELLQKTDGINLPYFDAAGYEVKPAGDSEWRYAPYGNWDADGRKASVDSSWTNDRDSIYAAPVVRES